MLNFVKALSRHALLKARYSVEDRFFPKFIFQKSWAKFDFGPRPNPIWVWVQIRFGSGPNADLISDLFSYLLFFYFSIHLLSAFTISSLHLPTVHCIYSQVLKSPYLLIFIFILFMLSHSNFNIIQSTRAAIKCETVWYLLVGAKKSTLIFRNSMDV